MARLWRKRAHACIGRGLPCCRRATKCKQRAQRCRRQAQCPALRPASCRITRWRCRRSWRCTTSITRAWGRCCWGMRSLSGRRCQMCWQPRSASSPRQRLPRALAASASVPSSAQRRWCCATHNSVLMALATCALQRWRGWRPARPFYRRRFMAVVRQCLQLPPKLLTWR